MNRSNATSRDPFKGMTKKAKAEAPAPRAPIQVSEHGRYQIKSGLLGGTYIARAFPKPPTQARGLIAEATGETEEAAIAALNDIIDARETRRVEDRRTDPGTGASVPSVEEYREALDHVALTRQQSAMLTALSLADPDGLTEARMANGAGYKSLASANRSLAAAGRLIATYLSSDAAAPGVSGDLAGSALLGFRGPQRTEKDPGNWILHPELREAIRARADTGRP